jgi:hypothetical protein
MSVFDFVAALTAAARPMNNRIKSTARGWLSSSLGWWTIVEDKQQDVRPALGAKAVHRFVHRKQSSSNDMAEFLMR